MNAGLAPAHHQPARASSPKGGDEGGGGGADDGAGHAGAQGLPRARLLAGLAAPPTRGAARPPTSTLPESLTTYRIMAVAADRASRFGRGEREIRISKPVLLRAAFPRFLARGDRATFGAALTSQLAERGHGHRDHAQPRSGRPGGRGRREAHGRRWRAEGDRTRCASTVRGPRGGRRADADDGEAARRDGRVRGDAARARRWSRPRWWPRTGRRSREAREALELPARRRARLRRAAAGAVVHRAGGPGRGRALPRRRIPTAARSSARRRRSP